MSYFGATDWYTEVKLGKVPGYSVVRIFGRNPSAGTSITDITALNAVYSWPTSAVQVEAISSSSNDNNSSGSGARVITVSGLNSSWAEASEDINMNGLSATSATSTSFIRINTAFVKTSGTYGSTTAGANAGNITVRTQSAGASHLSIISTDQIGVAQAARFTVPDSQTGYLIGAHIYVDSGSNKVSRVSCWRRENADDVTTPFTAKRLVLRFDGMSRGFNYLPSSPIGPFPARTDIWWSSTAGQSATPISVDFEMLVVDN